MLKELASYYQLRQVYSFSFTAFTTWTALYSLFTRLKNTISIKNQQCLLFLLQKVKIIK